MDTRAQIALIDDNRDWVRTLAEYLHRQGFAVRTAYDGRQGLALLEQPGIRVALVDFNMPGMTGLELLRQLRARRRSVVVLLVSSDDDPTLAARVRAEGGRAFLSKTTSPQLLLQAVRLALAPPPSEQAARLEKPWNRLLPAPRGGRRNSCELGSN
jgi:DNA-binding response OmpR family regulator